MNHSSSHYYISKYNSNGNYLWAKNYLPVPEQIGGGLARSSCDIKDLEVDINSTYWITGNAGGTVDFDFGQKEELIKNQQRRTMENEKNTH